MPEKPHNIIIGPEVKLLDRAEIKCGFWLTKYFHSDIEFIPTASSNTPDIRVVRLHQYWEIKNITGNGKNTIHHAMSGANRQSNNLIITLIRSRMTPKVAIGRIKHEISKTTPFKRIILITKSGKILEIK